jgi:hypothetical protein
MLLQALQSLISEIFDALYRGGIGTVAPQKCRAAFGNHSVATGFAGIPGSIADDHDGTALDASQCFAQNCFSIFSVVE